MSYTKAFRQALKDQDTTVEEVVKAVGELKEMRAHEKNPMKRSSMTQRIVMGEKWLQYKAHDVMYHGQGL